MVDVRDGLFGDWCELNFTAGIPDSAFDCLKLDCDGLRAMEQGGTEVLSEALLSWKHPGFSVFQGDSDPPDDHHTRQRLARYCVHPHVALDRLHYDAHKRQVTYDPKNHDRGSGSDAPAQTPCSALDFLAALCTHIPDAGQQLIRYYGAWSHVRRARAQPSCRAPVVRQNSGRLL